MKAITNNAAACWGMLPISPSGFASGPFEALQMPGRRRFIRPIRPEIFLAALAMFGWLCAVPAQSQRAGPGRAGNASIYSTDRRFMVSGMTSAENMVLVGRLSEWAHRVEAVTGMPLPMERDQLISVMVQSLSSPDTQILKMQGWDNDRFFQRLVVPGVLRLDGEDLQEAVCWLLLNRYAAAYTPLSLRTGMGAAVPDWLSAGLAQNLQAAIKSRNRDWISRELTEGRMLRLSDVIRQELLPPGRWREKAYAAAAVEFLFPSGDRTVWGALLKAVGTRRHLDAAWLRQNSPALSTGNPETAWRDYLAARSRARTVEAWSDHSLRLEERLLQILNFRPHDMAAGVSADVPPNLFARDLMEYRAEAWMAPVASALSLQVQSLKLGAPPALQDVFSAYTAYFGQLLKPPAEKTSWWRRAKNAPREIRPPDDATWLVALNQLWLRAERAHQEFLERYQTRKRYVDAFDRVEPSELEEAPPAWHDVPRTRLQQAVDEVEQRLSR
ncbi:MAG: hypothetical protein LBN38_08435 [Verrucomicrobiota bacterium]|nr:hypothetical protein [Verrucomicrobiota bacterium]